MQWDFNYQTVDMLLSFLRIDKTKVDIEKVEISFDNNGIKLVDLVYTDKRTNKLNRCLIGINGLDKPNVITPGLYNR